MSDMMGPAGNSRDFEKPNTAHDVLKPFTRSEMSNRKPASSAYKYPVLKLMLLFLRLTVLTPPKFQNERSQV